VVRKRRPQSGWGGVEGLSSVDIFRKRREGKILQMRKSALFGVKNFEFFEIYGVSARTRGEGGLSHCGHFADNGGRGSIFRNFVRTSFMDGLLHKSNSHYIKIL